MRYIAIAGPVLAAAFGIFTAFSTFQPELKKKQEERQGIPHERNAAVENKDNVISQAILSDIREAQQKVTQTTGNRGFAWGIRNALFGKDNATSAPDQDAGPSSPDPSLKK